MKAFEGDVIAACKLTDDTITEILHPFKSRKTRRLEVEDKLSDDRSESP